MMKTKTASERRTYPRKQTALPLEIYASGSGRFIGRGFVTNVSRGGVALETSKAFRPGEKVTLRVNLLDESTYVLPGEIVYSAEGILSKAYGARFTPAQDGPSVSGFLSAIRSGL